MSCPLQLRWPTTVTNHQHWPTQGSAPPPTPSGCPNSISANQPHLLAGRSSLHLCQMQRWCWRRVWVVLPCGHTVYPSPSHPSYTKSWNTEKYQRLEPTPDHFSKILQDKSQPSIFCKSSPSDSDVQSGSRTFVYADHRWALISFGLPRWC